MSIPAIRAVLDGQFNGDALDVLVLVAIAERADGDGRAFPGLDDIARRTRLHKATVARRLSTLMTAGWLERSGGGGRGRKADYRLNVARMLGEVVETVAQARQKPADQPVEKLSRNVVETVAQRGRNCRADEPPHIVGNQKLNQKLNQKPALTRGSGSEPEGHMTSTALESRTATATPSRNKPAQTHPDVPAWIPAEPWARYLQHRRELRKAMTPTATARLIAKLETMHAAGDDIGAALDESVANSWTGVFPPKGRATTKPSQAMAAMFGPLTDTPEGIDHDHENPACIIQGECRAVPD